MRQQALGLFVFHDGYVAQIAVELVEIEAEAHHEAVGDLEAAKVHRDLHDAARVAVQERAYRQRIRRPAGQGLQQVAQGEAGIDDILDQQYVFALDALIQILGDAHHAGGAALVGETGDRKKIDFDGNFDVARQRGEACYGEMRIEEHSGKLSIHFTHTPDLAGDLEHGQYDTFVARWKKRSLDADAYVAFTLKPDGSVDAVRMAAVSPLTDFSFDFQDLLFRPVAINAPPT